LIIDRRTIRMILCKRDIDTMRNLAEEQWDITVAVSGRLA
jgi:hypothetical protein